MTSLPLVLVHGFLGGGRQWDLQREHFGYSHNLVTPDLPGFGENPDLEAPDTISGFAKFVLDELDRLEVERFALLGHSMGGMIVQEMVALEPDRVERLVLYGTASSGNLPDRFEPFEKSRRRIQEDGVKSSARRIAATWFAENENAKQYESCAAIAECSSLQAMQAGLNAMESWSRTENLSKISCPTLIIWGEKDRTYGWQQIEKLWSTIPMVELSVLPGCSHAAHLEKPHLFNLVLRDFLDTSRA